MEVVQNRTMSTQNRILGTVIVCVIVIVLSVAGLASDFMTRLISSVDGLLLLMICLMMAGIFSLMVFVLAKEAGWLPSRSRAAVAATSAGAPSRPPDQPVQPNQATHPVAQAPAAPAKPAPVTTPAPAKSPIKAGEGS
jgi:hypothetical protein